jgi:hypothetical protein
MKKLKLLIPLVISTAIPSFIVNLSAIGTDNLQSQSGFYPTLNWVFINRFWIVPICAVIGGFTPIYKALKTEKEVKRNVTKKLLKTLLTDVFNDDTQNTRITIFREVSIFKIFWLYIKEAVRHPIKFCKNKNKHSFPGFFEKYIIATERVGTENPSSKTYFRFVAKTKKECEGVASVVKQTEKDLKIDNLPDINNINIDEFDNLSEKIKNDINDYIEATFIKDVASLKRLHLKARHFYATILKDEMLESKAVLIIDSISDVSPFDDEAINKVSGYIKVFSTTF